MALSTYAELKTAVATWCRRTDLTTQIVDFVKLAESQIRRDVRCRAMETLVSGTLAADEVLAQPTRFLEARRLTVNGDVYEYVDTGTYSTLSSWDSQELKFTNVGTDIYILNGLTGDDYTLLYWQGFAAFSADSDTNWLLTNAPEIYLSGALQQAGIFLSDDEMMAKHAAIYQVSVKNLKSTEQRSQYSGSRLEVRAN
jgi:hypothetical protein